MAFKGHWPFACLAHSLQFLVLDHIKSDLLNRTLKMLSKFENDKVHCYQIVSFGTLGLCKHLAFLPVRHRYTTFPISAERNQQSWSGSNPDLQAEEVTTLSTELPMYLTAAKGYLTDAREQANS